MIPVKVNGEKLSFILDTGVNKTILFDPTKKDSVHIANISDSMLRGLGIGESVHAITSNNNKLTIKNLQSVDETIYITLNNSFDFSSKMGITIHGIIGYSLLKNFIVKINYKSHKITFYNPKTFTYKKCKNCVTKPLELIGNKPYINAQIGLNNHNKLINVKLLIDSGGSDAMWLFENSKKQIKTPKLFFNDILGEGLSGSIYGKRSRLTTFKLDAFEINQPTVSFLDSTTTYNVRKFKSRNGSIGGRILKRFIIWFDYTNNKVTFKKNGSFVSDFNYNMSGLDIVYNGQQLVRQKKLAGIANSGNNTNSTPSVFMYSYEFKPSYRINNVVKNSPSDIAGLQKNDVILKINNKAAHELTLGDIFYKLQEKDKKKVKITVNRKEEKLKFEFVLKKEI